MMETRHQRPLLSRELRSVWPASLRIDRGAPWRNRTGYGGFGKPCHVERSFNLPKQHVYCICLTFSSLGIWNDVEWWQLLGSAGKSLEPPWQLIKALNLGCPWRSAELTLSNQNHITHNFVTDQWKHTMADIDQVNYVLVILLPWHSHKIWWKLCLSKTPQKKKGHWRKFV